MVNGIEREKGSRLGIPYSSNGQAPPSRNSRVRLYDPRPRITRYHSHSKGAGQPPPQVFTNGGVRFQSEEVGLSGFLTTY